MTELIDTTEMYLKTVYELEEDGVPPLRARIVERLDHSGPTVSQTVARMERDGLIKVAEDRSLELTDEGRRRATDVIRKHRLAERLLLDVIGIERRFVHDEACRWEHVMSEQVEERLADILDDVSTDPFGNPVPSRTAEHPRPSADEATRCAVRKERDLTDLACYRGQMPPEAEFLFVDPDPDYDAESLALYSQEPTEMSEAQIEQRAQVMVSRMEARLPPERLAALASSVDSDAVRGLFSLIGATGYPDARLTRALEREFLTAIDRWRSSE